MNPPQGVNLYIMAGGEKKKKVEEESNLLNQQFYGMSGCQL